MDLEVDPQELVSLGQYAQICVKQFVYLSSAGQHQQNSSIGEDVFWASRQSAEFNLWCTNIGVHTQGRQSLDVRLKDVPEICAIILQLLRSLHHDLDNLIHQPSIDAAHSDTDNSCDNGESKSDDSSLSFDSLSSSQGSQALEEPVTPEQKSRIDLMHHVEETIDRLRGQERWIERAGAQHRQNRIEMYRKKPRSMQEYEGLKELGLRKVNIDFKLATEPIKERIAESFARRRIRFEYLKEHQKKRAINKSEAPVSMPVPLPQRAYSGDIIPAIPGEERPKQPFSLHKTISQKAESLASATVDTKYEFIPEPKKRDRAQSVISVAIRNPAFPPAPRVKGGRFECPYCMLEFRGSEATQGQWSQHVMFDFEPYFCTFEGCTAPFDVPNSFDGLLEHMQSHLPLRHHVDGPDGKHRDYGEIEFEQHARSHGEISSCHMTAMKEASRRKGAFLFGSCPFCGGYPEDLESMFDDPESPEAQEGLRRHIKKHMQEFALFLPPYRSDVMDPEDHSNASENTHHRSLEEKALVDPEGFVDFCDNQDCDCNDYGSGPYETDLEFDDSVLLQDYSLNGWRSILRDKFPYDFSEPSDPDLIGDKHLQSFILRFAQAGHVRETLAKYTVPPVQDANSKEPRFWRTADASTIVRYLLGIQQSENPEEELQKPLWLAARNGELNTVRDLLAHEKATESTDLRIPWIQVIDENGKMVLCVEPSHIYPPPQERPGKARI